MGVSTAEDEGPTPIKPGQLLHVIFCAPPGAAFSPREAMSGWTQV